MLLSRLARHDGLNFLLTNRIPRRLASQWVGRISQSENRLVRGLSLWVWQRFTDLDLSDAAKTRFRSMHDCFTRQLRPGARPIDPDPGALTSPCDVGFAKGAEMGWFEHGSTIVVLAGPGLRHDPALQEGARIRMGHPLLRMPNQAPKMQTALP